MADEIDPLGGEVSLEVKLDEKGIKASAKSRTIAAIDRLCGNLVDLPGGFFEGKAKQQRIQNDLKAAILIAEGQAALDKLTGDSNFGQRVIDGLSKNAARKQLNKDSVAIEAIEDLRSANTRDFADDGLVDDDWLNVFERYAEDASSDHLQKLWGRILSGEIRQPGSFSLSTLRFISELDKDIAATFEKIVAQRFWGQFIWRETGVRGEAFLNLTFLEEIGLLHEVSGNMEIQQKFSEDGIYNFRSGNFLVMSKGNPGSPVHVPVVKITRIGKELCTILPHIDHKAVAKKIADFLAGISDTVDINLIIQDFPDEHVNFIPFEKVK